MRFVDRVRILVRAGHGGRGHVGWRREKFVPYGGPAGGDGGRGGDVILVADDSLTTLLDLRYRQHYQAEHGQPGRNKCQNGSGGEDLRIRVPVGTVVYLEAEAGEPGDRPPWQRDLDEDGDDGVETIYVFEDELGEDEDEAPTEDAATEDAPDVEATAVEATAEVSEVEALTAADREQHDFVPVADRATPQPSGDEEADAPREDAIADVASAEVDASTEGDEAFEEEADEDEAEADEEVADEAEARELPILGDLIADHQTLTVAKGGRGGRGNIHFRSSTNRAPDFAESGTRGQAFWLRLELKLLADVGIVGFPNVGKSTLIRTVSRARPRVGDYPFTTLVPHLGVVGLPGERSMVIADVPGLIRGASEGKGLGLDFLRHLERTRVLLHLLAPDPEEGREPIADLEALEEELAAYGDVFTGRPRVVALNKVDTDAGRALIERTRKILRARKIPLFPISAATGEGVPALLEALWRRVQLSRERAEAAEAARAAEEAARPPAPPPRRYRSRRRDRGRKSEPPPST